MRNLSLREMREKTKPNKKGKPQRSKAIKKYIYQQSKHRLFTSNSTFPSILAGNITKKKQKEHEEVMAKDS